MSEASAEIDPEKLGRTREMVRKQSIRDTSDAASREVIRVPAVRDLVALAEEGAFAALLEPDVEERMWGDRIPRRCRSAASPNLNCPDNS